MLVVILYAFLGLCATGDAAVTRGGSHRLLEEPSGAGGNPPLTTSDLVIVYTTTSSRLPLVHATRPARHGIRTLIVLQDASEAARLNELYGGAQSEHNETYVAWVDPVAGASGGGGSGGPYGRTAPQSTHPLHLIGPAWAMAPLLAHTAVLTASSTPPVAGATAAAAAAPPPPPYRWMLIARDDTLWRPRQVIRLLSKYDAGVAVAISDHLVDFNGRNLLAPSSAAAVCLPCGMNLTALLGRRHPPGVPQPACPVCRPAGGCEFRFDLCRGLAGGPQCATKRFLGSGDRCAHSWAAGGAGAVLSVTLLSYLDQEDWASCVRGQRPSTGERSLGRCLWRHGFSFTHPAEGLAQGLTRDVFSERHIIFGNPLLRQDIFGALADELLGPAYRAEEAAAKATAAAATAAAMTAAGPGGNVSASEAMGPALPSALASTRERSATAAAAEQCDADCRRWLDRSGVSVHLDVPHSGAVDVTAAAALLQKAAEAVAAAARKR